MIAEDFTLELSRITREAHDRVRLRMASEQLGEAFVDLDRRLHSTIARGPDRREYREAA